MSLYIGNKKVTPIKVSGTESIKLQDKDIIENGTYTADAGYTGLGTVNVNVSGGDFTGIPREISSSGVYQLPSTDFTFTLPSNATDVGDNVLLNAFNDITGSNPSLLNLVDLSSLKAISGNNSMQYAFSGCNKLISADLSGVISISGNNSMQSAFSHCQNLISVDLSSLTTISGFQNLSSAFDSCYRLTSVNLSNLETISSGLNLENAFYYCVSLVSVDLSSLTTVMGTGVLQSTFSDCQNLISVDLSNLKQIGSDVVGYDYAQFYSTFSGTKITELSLPNLEYIYCSGGSYSSAGTFAGNDFEKIYLPKLKNISYCGTSGAEKFIFANCRKLTEIHFGAENEESIKSTTGYSTLWGRGAGNATVYFDL